MSTPGGLLDGRWVEAAQAQVALASEGFQFGLGVFTTMGVRDGRLLLASDHEARLQRDLAQLAPEAAAPVDVLRRAEELAQRVPGLNGLKVIWFLDRGVVREWIQPRPHAYTAEVAAASRRLQTVVCGERRERPLARVKSLNYAEHALAARAARQAGWDDALWIDSAGRLLEATTASLWVRCEGVWFTPPLTDGVLAGTARAWMLRTQSSARERTLTRRDLETAEAVVVANALGGPLPVSEVEGRKWALPNDPVWQGWQAAWTAL